MKANIKSWAKSCYCWAIEQLPNCKNLISYHFLEIIGIVILIIGTYAAISTKDTIIISVLIIIGFLFLMHKKIEIFKYKGFEVKINTKINELNDLEEKLKELSLALATPLMVTLPLVGRWAAPSLSEMNADFEKITKLLSNLGHPPDVIAKTQVVLHVINVRDHVVSFSSRVQKTINSQLEELKTKRKKSLADEDAPINGNIVETKEQLEADSSKVQLLVGKLPKEIEEIREVLPFLIETINSLESFSEREKENIFNFEEFNSLKQYIDNIQDKQL